MRNQDKRDNIYLPKDSRRKKVKKVSDKRLIFLDPKEIIPPKTQEADNDRYKLFLLSESIRENGLLIPVIVKKTQYGYEVISGERRIKASILAEKQRIPCVVTEYDGEPSLFKAVESFTKRETDISVQSEILKDLTNKYGKEKIAACVGLTTGELMKIIENPHNIEDLPEKEEIIIEPPKIEHQAHEKRLPPIKDVRFLINSIKKLSESVSEAGTPVKYKQKENQNYIELSIRIDKGKEQNQLPILI